MNHNEHIELSDKHYDIVCQQRVIDVLNNDTATLESIQHNLELTLSSGGMDTSARDMIEVTVNAAMSKYGMESISLESSTSPVMDSQITMEKIGENLKKFGGAVKKKLIAIWQSIVKFFKWIGSLFGIKKKETVAEIEKVKKFCDVVKDTAAAVDNGTIAKELVVTQDGVESIMMSDLPFVVGTTPTTAQSDQKFTPAGEQPTVRQKLLPKAVLMNMAVEVTQPVSRRTKSVPYGSVFVPVGKTAPSAEGIINRAEASMHQTYVAMESITRALGPLFELLEKHHRDPNLRGVTDGFETKEVKEVALHIYNMVQDGTFAPGARQAMPGLVLTHSLKHPGDYDEDSIRTYFKPSDFKLEFKVPEVSEAEIPMLSMGQSNKYNNEVIKIIDEKQKMSKQYDRYLKINLSKYMTDDLSPEVSWCLNWIVKLTSVVVTTERYTTHCAKYMNLLKRDSLKALFENK